MTRSIREIQGPAGRLEALLEPLLATPITTTELLLAKVAGAMIPSLAIMMCTTIVYMIGVAALAEPGVLRALLSLKTALLVLGLGPITSCLALQVGVLVSARVNDPRTAQQFGALFILPLTGLFMHTKVVFRATKALASIGCAVLRFNFRGVGASAGTWDEGPGELADYRAALDTM